MDRRRWGWGVTTLLLLASFWHVSARLTPASDPPSTTRLDPLPPGSAARGVGAGRCSAIACHGSAQPAFGSNILHDEHATWITLDPHAEAYAVLRSDLSQGIVRRLNHGFSPALPAHKDDRCLVCHATTVQGSDPVRQDGVGCESCHGHAERWLTPHTTGPWAAVPARIREDRFGMIQTKDLARRASVCAECHVGSPAKDGRPARSVDHDLIAAGHPRLDFELSAFLANLPAHWNEKGRNADADFPARAWAIGQVVSARSALEQLGNRARSADKQPGRWPEFSEYDCNACHHNLSGSTASAPSQPDRLVGTLTWGSWYFPMTRTLSSEVATHSSERLETLLDRLARSMGASYPDPKTVADQAEDLSGALARWLSTRSAEPFDAARVDGLLRVIPKDRERPGMGWDAERQRYLALVPLRQALVAQARDDPDLLPAIQRLRDRLRAQDPAGQPSGTNANRP